MNRLTLYVFLLFLFPVGMLAQDVCDTTDLHPLRKSRIYVGIGGSVSSSYTEHASNPNSNIQLGNNYRFNLKLGKFIAPKNLLGIYFTASRTQLVGLINSSAEILSVGPWYRYYIGKDPNIALFLQTSILYSSYFGTSEGNPALLSVDETLEVMGINGSIGLGMSYTIADRICFEVSCSYGQARYWGTYTDFVLYQEIDVSLNRGEMLFDFGIGILFNRIKNDD